MKEVKVIKGAMEEYTRLYGCSVEEAGETGGGSQRGVHEVEIMECL